MPERFLKTGSDGYLVLDTDVPDPAAAFGFGRRGCPGKYMAYESLWLAAACVLAVFDIAPAKDEHGKPIMPTDTPQDGFASYVVFGHFCTTVHGLIMALSCRHPKSFVCTITPRSKEHEELIRETKATE